MCVCIYIYIYIYIYINNFNLEVFHLDSRVYLISLDISYCITLK